jgi:hypothetical protein
MEMELIMSDMLSELVITERRSSTSRIATFEASHQPSPLASSIRRDRPDASPVLTTVPNLNMSGRKPNPAV